VRTPRYGTPHPAEGVPVKGSFLGSTMDNFERSAGMGSRFGVAYVGFKTQKLTPKLRSAWHKEAAQRNAVV
jgi:beta-glucosidase/6-phospho-beta-glucosidase/beta-galactosidase